MNARSEPDPSDDWNAHWEHFHRSASENPAQIYRHLLLLSRLRREVINPLKLLDLGCGQGDFLAEAAKAWPDAELVGFDISETGVYLTRQRVPQARVFTVDLFDVPTEVSSLVNWANASVCCEVLEHVDDPVAFLRASKPYLANNALLVVTVPRGPMSAFDRHIGHRQHFTRKSITRVLERAGFEIEHLALAGFPFFNLYRLLVIAGGARLIRDATTKIEGLSFLSRRAMAIFRVLFRANLFHSRFGWQIVVVARKVSASDQ